MRTRFRLLVHESSGQKYEDLFVKIMTYADPYFKPVKAHGSIGDRGNDGWSSVSGKYYQCFAPENLAKNTVSAKAKMKRDFLKLKNYWDSISSVQKYVFVVNDRFQGVSPHITKVIREIEKENNLNSAEIWGASELERILFSLKDDQISQILGSQTETRPSNFYAYIVNEALRCLHLPHWMTISDNLIAEGIQDSLVDSFSDFTCTVFRTQFPGTHPELDEAIQELSLRVQALIEHFTATQCAYLSEDGQWWKIDKRWKREIIDQPTYEQKSNECEEWRKKLFSIHCNLVVALNFFAAAVRATVDADFLMNQRFVVNDSLGTYNSLTGYQYIPTKYREI